MTVGGLSFAQACVRGGHTALAAFKAWAATQELTPADVQFLKELDRFAGAAKEWVRAKAVELVPSQSEVPMLLAKGEDSNARQ